MTQRRALAVSITLMALTLPFLAQSQELPRRLGGSNAPRIADPALDRPAPKLPDGTVDLDGLWTGGGPTQDMEAQGGLKPGELESLMLPWAKQLFASRTDDSQDPYSYCMPAGVPRMVANLGWRFVQHKTTHIFLLYEGNMRSYRQIFMDGRKHPEDPSPTWFGHSIGRWDGDTLVIDSMGFNDKFWFDRRGHPHSEQLHTIERWTRLNFTTLQNSVTIDDPGAYARPFTVNFRARLGSADSDIMEYICIENNQFGLAGGITRPSAGK